jgi:NADPH:quinone reductase-like Zn-dependent oxidoreductase
MSYPQTYHAWRRTTGPYPHTIRLSTESLPGELGPNEVLVRIHAVGLNYRDTAMLQGGKYPVPVEEGGISGSDCAAEVVAVGPKVQRFVVGDRVAPTVDSNNLTDNERNAEVIALGGNRPGVLREYAVFGEKVLVKLPKGMSWEEVCQSDGP